MDGQRFKRRMKTFSVLNTTSSRYTGSASTKMTLKSSKQQANAKIAAKKRKLNDKSKKHKDILLSSSEAKKLFSRTKNDDGPVVYKDIFMALHPYV